MPLGLAYLKYSDCSRDSEFRVRMAVQTFGVFPKLGAIGSREKRTCAPRQYQDCETATHQDSGAGFGNWCCRELDFQLAIVWSCAARA